MSDKSKVPNFKGTAPLKSVKGSIETTSIKLPDSAPRPKPQSHSSSK